MTKGRSGLVWTSSILQLKQPFLSIGSGFAEDSETLRRAATEEGVHWSAPGVGDCFRCSQRSKRDWSVGIFVFEQRLPLDFFPDHAITRGHSAVDLAQNEGILLIGGIDNDGPDILMKFDQPLVHVHWEARGSTEGIDVVALSFG